MVPEQIAKAFHDAYELLAPSFGYKTREASAVPWEHVPEQNKNLMIAVVRNLVYEQRILYPASYVQALEERIDVATGLLDRRQMLRLEDRFRPQAGELEWRVRHAEPGWWRAQYRGSPLETWTTVPRRFSSIEKAQAYIDRQKVESP